jgi:hypothetical protein
MATAKINDRVYGNNKHNFNPFFSLDYCTTTQTRTNKRQGYPHGCGSNVSQTPCSKLYKKGANNQTDVIYENSPVQLSTSDRTVVNYSKLHFEEQQRCQIHIFEQKRHFFDVISSIFLKKIKSGIFFFKNAKNLICIFYPLKCKCIN